MEIASIIFLIALIRGFATALGKRRAATTAITNSEPDSLCASCAYAHVARGYRERDKLVACTFGGTVRPLQFAVSNCTSYCNRNAGARQVRVAGFAESVDGALAPTVAAKINTDQTES